MMLLQQTLIVDNMLLKKSMEISVDAVWWYTRTWRHRKDKDREKAQSQNLQTIWAKETELKMPPTIRPEFPPHCFSFWIQTTRPFICQSPRQYRSFKARCGFLHQWEMLCYARLLRDRCPQPRDDLIVHCPIIQMCCAVLHHVLYESLPSSHSLHKPGFLTALRPHKQHRREFPHQWHVDWVVLVNTHTRTRTHTPCLKTGLVRAVSAI